MARRRNRSPEKQKGSRAKSEKENPSPSIPSALETTTASNPSEDVSLEELSLTADSTTFPSRIMKWTVTVVAVLHLGAMALSYAAIVEPSSTHGRLLEWVSPYLRLTHFGADGRPYYLAHATSDEQPHRLQVATLTADQSPMDLAVEWKTVEPQGVPGLAESDRYSRWMKLTATLAESEQSSLAASMLIPLIRNEGSINALRIVRLPTQLTTAVDDAKPPPYVARVVRHHGDVRLVSTQEARLTTSPRSDPPSRGTP